MTEESNTDTPRAPDKKDATPEYPPRRTLEDWELLQTREEPPLKVPWWFVGMVIAMLAVSTLLALPLLGQRPGYERPWFDWGMVIGIGYGVVFLVIIYFFMRGRKSRSKALASAKEK